MRIPTAIIISDGDNRDLVDIEPYLKKIVRVYKRNSLDGERLYNVREGIIFFDGIGNQQKIWQDYYSKVIPELIIEVEQKGKPGEKALLYNYLFKIEPNEQFEKQKTEEIEKKIEEYQQKLIEIAAKFVR